MRKRIAPTKCPVCGKDHREWHVALACNQRWLVLWKAGLVPSSRLAAANDYLTGRFGRKP